MERSSESIPDARERLGSILREPGGSEFKSTRRGSRGSVKESKTEGKKESTLLSMSSSSKSEEADFISENKSTVKFDASLPASSINSHLSLDQIETNFILDETVRMFDCMPKGFENFVESGPYRRVIDYLDYDKMGKTERKNAEYMREQKEPQANRARDIEEKLVELQDYFRDFDHYTEEFKKKADRARAHYKRLNQAVQEMSIIDIPRSLRQLDYYKGKKDKLITAVDKYLTVNVFVEQLVKSTDAFSDFTGIMDRHSTLDSTNRYLMKKFDNSHQYLQEAADELQIAKDSAKQREMVLRKEITELKQKLDHLITENHNMEQQCHKWASHASQKVVTFYDMTMGIHNMANSLMEVRPYTKRGFSQCESVIDLIELIGTLVIDYSDIVKESGIKKKKKTKTKQNKRGGSNKPSPRMDVRSPDAVSPEVE